MKNNKCEYRYIHTTFIEMKRYESHYRHKLHVTALAIFIAESLNNLVIIFLHKYITKVVKCF